MAEAEVQTYDIGDSVKLLSTWTVSDVLTDPGTVVYKVKPPRAAEIAYTYGTDSNVTRLSLGKFQCVVDPNDSGPWQWKVFGTGAAKGAQEHLFEVRQTVFA